MKLRIVKFLTDLKFRHKLIISYIVIIIIPISVLGLYSFSQAKRFLLTEARRQLTEYVHQAALDLDYKMRLYNKTISHITFNSQIPRIIYYDRLDYFYLYINYRDVLDPLFTTILSLNEDFNRIMIYTANPNIPKRAETFAPLSDIENSPTFIEAVAERGVNWTTMDGTLVGFFRFVPPHRTSPVNYLFVEMKHQNVFASPLTNTSPYAIYVTDENRNIVYSQNMLGDAYFDDLGADIAEIRNAEIEVNGNSLLLIRGVIPETGWKLHYVTPESLFLVSSYRILETTVLIILLCVVGLLLLSLLFSRTIVKRLESLNRGMTDVVDGNRHIEIGSNSKDEIGELTNRFGDMLFSINKLIDEVYNDRIVLREAELKTLQAQITPHFLYNTLSLVNGMAIQSGELAISRLTKNISRFYRTVLNDGRNITTVRDEIANTRTYINIQLVMHDDSFDVEYDLMPEVFDFKMINLVLQPLVENAIEHGIDQIRNGRGLLRITGRLEGECLMFLEPTHKLLLAAGADCILELAAMFCAQ